MRSITAYGALAFAGAISCQPSTGIIMVTGGSPPAGSSSRPDGSSAADGGAVTDPGDGGVGSEPDSGATSADSGFPLPTGDPIFVGAGDIAACGSGNDGATTAAILDGLFANGVPPNSLIFTVGDNAYEDGTLDQYTSCYGPTWGRYKYWAKPSAGNHEWHTTGAAGYFAYYGSQTGGDANGAFYSYDLGAWHIVALDSFGTSVSAGSPQEQWLRADLAAHPTQCALAYFHAPRFSSGYHGSSTWEQDLWQALYDNNVDVVISAHDHDYERFAPQDPAGNADPTRGIREFVVGTGGNTTYVFGAPITNSELRYSDGYGVIKLTLRPSSYEWQFISEAGKTFSDQGSNACH